MTDSKNRIFVEKTEAYRVEAESLRKELNSNLGLDIKSLRLLAVYDLFGFSNELLDKASYRVFGEPATDRVAYAPDFNKNFEDHPYLAMEFLPGQFDQRAASAEECVKLLEPSADVEIRSGRLMIFDDGVSAEDLEKIAHYCINPVESRRKDLSRLAPAEKASASEVAVLDGFCNITPESASAFCKEKGLAMNADDLMEVVNYFKSEGRDPNETELRILDTYWSDHCRHTTFTTNLTDIQVEDSLIAEDIRNAVDEWHRIRKELGREEKSLCLMDLATIGARYLRNKGLLDDMEQSEENNACSVFVDVDVDGTTERWLLQFKNETHNHPTEIEPFGGASTCLGGAIRDPLSGRSYVYQAMRVTGAGNIWQPVSETMAGKLAQRVISLRAAAGYSSYGNQIGLATTHVREIYHPGYIAKRLEVGAVVGAVKASDVRRERPVPGDIILMFGGRTGRDGIGGATGSSKEHTTASLEECGSEVQKGNAPEERKIARLFRRPEVTRLIKKSNDFGAGGVSVAIGELTDGLDIYLDRVPTKYSGLNPTELAISESQERMSVVIDPKDREEFEKYCAEENLEVTHVADVTDTSRMRMYYNGKLAADLRRDFIDSAGAPHYAKAVVGAVEDKNPFARNPEGENIKEKFEATLRLPNVTSQKGLIEMFDSSIGASTVLMPFGGRRQATETQVSVQKLPVGNHLTHTASLMSYGFNPDLSAWSPYHGAAYAVVDAVAKAAAAGQDFSKMRFSYQEYFQKMNSDKAWGLPLAALLGALRMQLELGLPSIGGKDSMSGTFADINVPPTLIAFGVGTLDARDVISPEFKEAGNKIYLLRHTPREDYFPQTEQLAANLHSLNKEIKEGNVVSAYAVGAGGIAEAVAKMSFGNLIGADLKVDEKELFNLMPGSVVVEAKEEIDNPAFELLGTTIAESELRINGEHLPIESLESANTSKFSEVYPDRSGVTGEAPDATGPKFTGEWPGEPTGHPKVFLPLFPGTNCDYDMIKAFEAEGAKTSFCVFRNLTAADIDASVEDIVKGIDDCHILALSGGFSQGDEPDGSGKFIASVMMNEKIKGAVERLLQRKGLIIGICNGFQALVKSGLLPYGHIGELSDESPTLFHNDINRHISQIVTTRIATLNSPWLDGFEIGQLHSIAASHGEGKFTCSKQLAEKLMAAGQIAFQYADPEGHATMTSPYNPNGSTFAIEGIISPDGLIIGKMGHSERYAEGLMKNIHGNKRQNLFANAVKYFNKK
ncbi:MAG: phosphoribosylformylglycinamidine synthase [Muribaculaceae bacterium]|nr:phosphoribosylformylglycinamidine synthase [Muribaculaceae bacterium]